MFGMINIDGAEHTTTACDRTTTQKLQESNEISGRTPSQSYWDPKNLTTLSTPNNSIFTSLENQVLSRVQHVLVSVQERNAETLTRIADSIYNFRPDPILTAVPERRTQNIEADDDPMIGNMWSKQMTQLQAQMSALSLDNTRYTRRRKRGQGRSILKNRLKQLGVCYYHAVFKKHAKNCRFPCSWDTKNGTTRL